MLSPDTPTYDHERIDPRLIAFARSPFEWGSSDEVEIPIGLIVSSLQGIRLFRAKEWVAAGTVGDLRGYLSWLTAPHPHPHVHVDYAFFHRPLSSPGRRAMTYNEAEGERIRTLHCKILFLHPIGVVYIRRAHQGLIPRLLIRREADGQYVVEYRYRSDFEEIFASILGWCFVVFRVPS